MDTVQPLEDRWSTRDYPVLVTVVRLLEEQDDVDADTVASELGITHRAAVIALTNLGHRHLNVVDMSTSDGTDNYANGVRPAGLEAAGQWPSADTAADRLSAALEAMVRAAPEGSEKRTRLVAVRDGLIGAGRDVLVEVASSVITGRIPL